MKTLSNGEYSKELTKEMNKLEDIDFWYRIAKAYGPEEEIEKATKEYDAQERKVKRLMVKLEKGKGEDR